MSSIHRPGSIPNARVTPTTPAAPAAPAAPSGATAFSPPPLVDANGQAIPTQRVTVNGLAGNTNNATGTTNRAARVVAFDSFNMAGNGRVGRGFIKTSASAIPGGVRVRVDSAHSGQNDKITLYLLAEVLDTKTNQLRTVTLSVLAKDANLNGTAYRATHYYDISYDDIRAFLKARNPALDINPGVTELAVAARWSTGHQAGGFARGGSFRLPAVGPIHNAVSVRAAGGAKDAADLPLDMQVAYPATLLQAVPQLQRDGNIVSRLESELKGSTDKASMTRALRRMYDLAVAAKGGDNSGVEALVGKDWTVETVDRYWLKDDGSKDLPGKPGSGAFAGYRVDDDGLPIQDPMDDVYMDDGQLGMTRHEGAIRLRRNKAATMINIKPGGGRRDDNTGITQRVEVGLELQPGATNNDAATVLRTLATNNLWSGTVFNHAQKEVHKLDPNLQLQNALQPWLDVNQDRHKFTLKNTKSGVEIELSFDKVKVKTLRPNLAGPDGAPREAEFYVLEAELDHLQLASHNQSAYAAGSNPQFTHFTTDQQQDDWLKATSGQVTLDLEPRLHELGDLENESFRKTHSYATFEKAVTALVPDLFPRGLGVGRQKSAHAAELLGLIYTTDAKLLAGLQQMIETAGYKWTPALKTAFEAAVADPAKKNAIDQNLINGNQLNVTRFLQSTVGNQALEYDLPAIKKRVAGHLAQLGYATTPEIDTMLDGVTAQKIAPATFEQYLARMVNYQDANVMSQFAQSLGVNPVPAPQADLASLLGPHAASGMVLRQHLTALNADPKQAAEIEQFFLDAGKAGATVYEIRRMVAAFNSNPQNQLNTLANKVGLAGKAPALRASVGHLAALAATRLRGVYLAVDDGFRAFLEQLSAKKPLNEAVNFVNSLNASAQTQVEQQAQLLGVTAPTLAPDLSAIDAYLQPVLQTAAVQYDAPLQQFVHQLAENGVPARTLYNILSQLQNTNNLAAALRGQNVFVVGLTPPPVHRDLAAIESQVRQNLQAYGAVIPSGTEVRDYVTALDHLGLGVAQIRNHASWTFSRGSQYANQQSRLTGANVPTFPIDVDAVCQYWKGRWGANWTPARETYIKDALPKLLAKGTMGMGQLYNQTYTNILNWLAQQSGVARPTGV